MRNPNCMRCHLHAKTRTVCLWGEGRSGTIMLVSGAPTYDDAFAGRPLWGEAGDLLDHVLFKLGHGREEIYITSLVKCFPGRGGLPKGKKTYPLIELCQSYLVEEINLVEPKVIVPMGSLAVKFLADINFISRADGYPVEVGGRMMVPCYHPSAALQSPSIEKNIAMALAKALELAGLPVRQEGKGLIYNYSDIGGLNDE